MASSSRPSRHSASARRKKWIKAQLERAVALLEQSRESGDLELSASARSIPDTLLCSGRTTTGPFDTASLPRPIRPSAGGWVLEQGEAAGVLGGREDFRALLARLAELEAQ